MEEAPRYTLLTLFSLFTLFKIVYTIQTSFHCLNSSVSVQRCIVHEGENAIGKG